MNVPVGIICIITGILSVNKGGGNKKVSLDIKDSSLFIIALASIVIALMQGGEWAWSDIKVLGLFLVSIVFFIGFIRVELTAKDPLVDLKLFSGKLFSAGNFTLFSSTVCLSSIVFIALWIQNVLNYSPATEGLPLLPATLPFIIMPTLTGIWTDKLGPL